MAEAGDLGCPGAAGTAGLPLLLVACGVLVDGEGRVLVTERPEGREMAGLWEFPGGKVEPGESPEAALVRELAEELGIQTAESCLAPCGFASHAYDRARVVLLAFALRKWQGVPAAREGQRLQWLPVPALFRLAMPPADRPLLGQIAAIL
ncbi:MAG: (deoxy)nucleoside triphosphate pyrophosphohydrolase [Thermaurantiacus tibetensis]|uniref:(deoxy)nucleoside triphosphate pyrophosphohydrolase n=1 Tax=Thermaurantiacus tibetensis TaxID=2759035 RepID=UPI001A9CAC83|nr:(deoxy)nucleoside triphosphate pyrophosphohydrolase [Thermaurantiacus tibetensis]